QDGRAAPGGQVVAVARLHAGLDDVLEQVARRAAALAGQLGVVGRQPLLQLRAAGRQPAAGRRRLLRRLGGLRRRRVLQDGVVQRLLGGRFGGRLLLRRGRLRQGRQVLELLLLGVIIDPLLRQAVQVAADAELDRRPLQGVADGGLAAVALVG